MNKKKAANYIQDLGALIHVIFSNDKMLFSTSFAVCSSNADVASSISRISFPLSNALAIASR